MARRRNEWAPSRLVLTRWYFQATEGWDAEMRLLFAALCAAGRVAGCDLTAPALGSLVGIGPRASLRVMGRLKAEGVVEMERRLGSVSYVPANPDLASLAVGARPRSSVPEGTERECDGGTFYGMEEQHG